MEFVGFSYSSIFEKKKKEDQIEELYVNTIKEKSEVFGFNIIY